MHKRIWLLILLSTISLSGCGKNEVETPYANVVESTCPTSLFASISDTEIPMGADGKELFAIEVPKDVQLVAFASNEEKKDSLLTETSVTAEGAMTIIEESSEIIQSIQATQPGNDKRSLSVYCTTLSQKEWIGDKTDIKRINSKTQYFIRQYGGHTYIYLYTKINKNYGVACIYQNDYIIEENEKSYARLVYEALEFK